MGVPHLHLARFLRGRLTGWVDAQSRWPHIPHPGSFHLERFWGPELSSPPTGDPRSAWLSGTVLTLERHLAQQVRLHLAHQATHAPPLCPGMDIDRGLDAGKAGGHEFYGAGWVLAICFSGQCSHVPEPGTNRVCARGQSLFQTPPRPALLGSEDRAHTVHQECVSPSKLTGPVFI